jgi:hypothetical protein
MQIVGITRTYSEFPLLNKQTTTSHITIKLSHSRAFEGIFSNHCDKYNLFDSK